MTTIREANTVEDALAVLKIRNEVREFMTRVQTEISEDEQLKWFNTRKENHFHLYAVEVEQKVVGYGLLSLDTHTRSRGRSNAALTGAVTASLRGKGYGRLIFSFLLAEAYILDAAPWLEVLTTNNAAISLYHELGFRETSRRSPVAITMCHFR